MTVFAEPAALYNVSATIICSLVYLICSHKGIRYHGVQVFVRTPKFRCRSKFQQFIGEQNLQFHFRLNLGEV